ncbi:MAG TPA: MlaE family lipid ABC transporter permease subunit [Kofleriaceae bacterium]|nr:MlaE family lipid ABC transporter permease subunit [Kofleriaceae bacterium]
MAWSIVQRGAALEVRGDLGLADGRAIWSELRDRVRTAAPPRLDLDLRYAESIDGAAMAMLVETRAELAARGVPCELLHASSQVAPLVRLYGGEAAPARVIARTREGWLSELGAAMHALGRRIRGLLAFIGELALAIVAIARRPSRANWRSIPTLASRAGADGVPIVLLLCFLVGFVMAFQTARQLQLYGANVFVADVVGISVVRELSPLMVAIIMSGRSGASYAAELGTMRVSEEIDALRVMGLAAMPYLIVPRIIALALVAPVLTLLGDVAGVVGGMAVAGGSLDVSPRGYVTELQSALVMSDVWTGLVKSFAFGIAIAFIGCQQGFVTRGAAAGVGRGTTATVVYCLFTIVLLDTGFTVLFRTLGL